ncbi:MAG: prepilin-type N-terminal cleavage/methylation domain-containing protein [Anaerosacchariphilus sp.]
MFKKLKENKKGFTLVELIVVLVILAILAALLVPALTGYIDRAKKKSVIAETRQAVMAAQTLVDEAYTKVDVGVAITVGKDTGTVKYSEIKDLAEVKGEITEVTLDTAADSKTPNKVTKLVYKNSTYTCTYEPAGTNNSDGDYNVAKVTN